MKTDLKTPLAIAPKRIKHLGINLTKDVNRYTENYIAWMKEIKPNLREKHSVFMDWKTNFNTI